MEGDDRPRRHVFAIGRISGFQKVVCAWCRRTMQEGPGEEVSHGMCYPCQLEWNATYPEDAKWPE